MHGCHETTESLDIADSPNPVDLMAAGLVLAGQDHHRYYHHDRALSQLPAVPEPANAASEVYIRLTQRLEQREAARAQGSRAERNVK